MDIREAFEAIVSMLREHDVNFGCSSSVYGVKPSSKLTHYGWQVLETAANAEADYLSEEYNTILAVTHRSGGGYVIHTHPFTWEPQDKYGFIPRMFYHIFHKYDPQLVEACVKVATDNSGDSMLYSEVRETNGVCRCHYGVKMYDGSTDTWEKVYEGTFPVES